MIKRSRACRCKGMQGKAHIVDVYDDWRRCMYVYVHIAAINPYIERREILLVSVVDINMYLSYI